MLIYIAAVYIIFRIAYFLLAHKNLERQTLNKLLGYLTLEISLAIIGIMGVVVLFAGNEINPTLKWLRLIVGAICLIASARVGLYVKRLARGELDQPTKTRMPSSKLLTFTSFFCFIVASMTVQGVNVDKTYLYVSLGLYAAVAILSAVSIRLSGRHSTYIGTEVKTRFVWVTVTLNVLLILISFLAFIDILMKS